MSYGPVPTASAADQEPSASASESAAGAHSRAKRPARRSLSDIIFPPQLSLPIMNPFVDEAPVDSSDDDESDSEDEAGGRYRDQDSDDSQDEKAELRRDDEALDGSKWAARAARTRVRLVVP